MDMLRFSTNAASCVQGSSARMDCAIPIPKQAQYDLFFDIDSHYDAFIDSHERFSIINKIQ